MILKRRVVHGRRNTVRHRTAQQADEAGRTGNIHRKNSLQIVYRHFNTGKRESKDGRFVDRKNDFCRKLKTELDYIWGGCYNVFIYKQGAYELLKNEREVTNV